MERIPPLPKLGLMAEAAVIGLKVARERMVALGRLALRRHRELPVIVLGVRSKRPQSEDGAKRA